MNERIRELKIQATLWCDDNIAEQYSEETNGYGAAWEDKFAELIVRECMDAVGNGPMERPAVQRIKAAFGVEYYEPIDKAFGVDE